MTSKKELCSLLNTHVWDQDPELFDLIKKEKRRQRSGLEMLASENFTSLAVLETLGSCLHNKYSEGLPGQRFNRGNTFVDSIERMCQSRALSLFGLDPEKWGVNVQPYSGTPANLAVYTALIEPNGRIMGLDLPDGGHMSHGYMTATRKMSSSSIFFQSMPYKVDPATGYIDYEKLAESARLFHPKVIVAGISCYSRCLDYKRFREIADENDAYLFSDMSHVSGLVAAKVIPSPFEYSDVVSTTTHKTLRGPKAGMIFYRKGMRCIKKNGSVVMYDLESKINHAVFPGMQGGPHNHKVGAVATALKQAATPEFVQYQQQIAKNAKILSEGLQKLGYKIVTGGTDVHLVLIDLVAVGLNGIRGELILERVNITCNKNTVPGDENTSNPSGIRLGTPALTTRGFVEKDMEQVIDFVHRALLIAKEAQSLSGPKLVNFLKVLDENPVLAEKVSNLKTEVIKFSESFPLPGFEEY